MRRDVLVAALPAALAVFVFGTIFGAAARPLLGTPLTIVASAVVFSGSVQFAMAALLLGGAAPVAAVLAATVLNLRNLVLGAVMRARVSAPPLARAGLAWFLTDEAVGLAVAGAGRAEAILLTAGVLLYVAWVAGTMVGLMGAALGGLDQLADAILPVLFVGLAAVSAVRRDVVVRSVAAAVIAVAVAWWLPAGRGVAPVLAVLVTALPGRPS